MNRAVIDGIPRVRVLGVELAQITRDQLVRYSIDALSGPTLTKLYAMHVVGLNILGENPAYEKALSNASLVYADGTSVMLAVRAAGHKLPERIATQDFMYDVISFCAANDHSVFLLGGEADLARKAGSELERRYPGLRIAGSRDGFFTDGAAVAQEIRESGAHLVLVGMGCPREQIWCDEHGSDSGPGLIMTVGGTFGYIVGEEKRAPRIVQKTGTEWLWRTAQDPSRLARRYFGGIPKLTKQILKARRDS
ncbi:MAG: WecB/TagA/CpsF family glycosyltransferase [Actinomycetota bacterium]